MLQSLQHVLRALCTPLHGTEYVREYMLRSAHLHTDASCTIAHIDTPTVRSTTFDTDLKELTAQKLPATAG